MPALLLSASVVFGQAGEATASLAVRGKVVHTMAGPSITDGVVVVVDGKITAVGPAGSVTIPAGMKVLSAEVVTPGLIDAHSTVGLTGILNIDHDQDQLERSSPIQPELRALDAYNALEELVKWVRSYGVTTLHTSHAPGELISGQSMIVKTTGNTVEDAMMVQTAAVAATFSPRAMKRERGKSPGTRGKMMAMLRAQFIKAQEYLEKIEKAEKADRQADAVGASDDAGDDGDKKKAKKPNRDLKLETLVRVLNKELPLMITANKAQDIAGALRLAREFDLRIWLDGAAEAYLMIDQIKAAGVPVFVHPPMMRAYGEMKNMSMETPAKLVHAGIPMAMQSGFEGYVPKTRVVLFEAAIAAANGLTFNEALASITISPARILGIDNRVGSLEIGKDGDLALYDGDPFEYTSHCTGVVIEGEVVSDTPR